MSTAAHARRVRGGRAAGRAAMALAAVACALAVAVILAGGGGGEPVLALARPVAAGQVITAADLRVVQATVSGAVSLVPASRKDRVTGRPAAASLPAGALLAAGDVGAAGPGPGTARLGVVLEPGRYPPGLSPGQHVDVLADPPPGSTARQPARLAGQAIVLSVSAVPGAAADRLAELQLPQAQVPAVAAAASAAGQVTLAVIPAAR